MSTTHEWIDLMTSQVWESAAPPAHLSWHRLGGGSAEDLAFLALAFPPAAPRGVAGAAPAARGRDRLGASGAVSWVPPFLSCGYHDPIGISLEIDAESGGGFVTRPALPEGLAAWDVLPRLIRRVQALLPPGTAVEGVDVHAVRLRGEAS